MRPPGDSERDTGGAHRVRNRLVTGTVAVSGRTRVHAIALPAHLTGEIMTTHGLLHLVAVLLTAGAVVVQGALLSGGRRRSAALGLVAAVLMLVAMVDAAYIGAVSPIAWTALLVVAGVGFAAAGSSRRRIVLAGGGPAEGVGVTTHDALGLVAMAALIPLMAIDVAGGDAGAHAGHGAGAGPLTVVVLAVALGHVVGAGAAFARSPGLGPRLSCTLMGGATAFMAAAVLA